MTVQQAEIDEVRRSCALRIELRERLVAKHGAVVPPASVLLDVSLALRLAGAAEELNRGAGAPLGG